MGDLLSFSYPEMRKVNYPEMFKEMSIATLKVQLQRDNEKPMESVYGEITPLITDERRHSGPLRVGSMLFKCTLEDKVICSNSSVFEVPLARSDVVVPSGWVLHTQVDLYVEIPNSNNEKPKHLNATLTLDKETTSQTVKPKGTGVTVEVESTWTLRPIQDQIIPQLSRPVQIERTAGHQLEVVYTIGNDVMSFTEFIMTLRRILADHSGHEDILDGHHFLNLHCSREHPLLAKYAEQPERWLHVKLKAVDPRNKTSSWTTTLVMRSDNLYVQGFISQKGVLHKLLDNKNCRSVIPEDYHHPFEELFWGISYPRLLGVEAKEQEAKCAEIAKKLTGMKLNRDFAVEAVRVLSSYPERVPGITLDPWVALAGLIVMVCEPPRMNPLHKAIADGWINGTAFTKKMVIEYLWQWATMSQELRTWRANGYPESDNLNLQLKDTYLVFHGKGTGTASKSSGAGRNGSDGSPPPDEAKGTDNSAVRPKICQPGPSKQEEGGSGDDPNQEPSKQGGKADNVQGHGRPMVELLSIHANLGILGKSPIIVSDGKRGQIIYMNEQGGDEVEKGQGEQESMDELVLIGPYTGIKAYGCFAIEIDIPRDAGGPIKWEWDCEESEYADQVDTPAQKTIFTPDGNKLAKITYAVMSNAREATVLVKLRQRDGCSPASVSGEITALIDGFKYRSVLFRHAKGTSRCFSTSDDMSWLLLELSRNVVAVPCGRVLHIWADLHIETDDGKKVELKVPLSFDNGICSSKTDDCQEVEVEVTWYPEVKMMSGPPPDVIFTIGDEGSLSEYIMDLRGFLTEHPDKEYILGQPVLAKQRAEQPARWLHINLQVVEGKKMYSTTLFMRDDNMYIHGFTNQNGVCYELLDNAESENMLPNNPQRLYWGLSYYNTLLGVQDDQVAKLLVAEGLGKSFAAKAVRRLSSSIHPDDQVTGMMCARVALAGLIFMACEPAKMNPLCDAITSGWSNGMRFTMKLMDHYVRKHAAMSRKLHAWKRRNFTGPHHFAELQATYLVLNTWLPDSSGQPWVEVLSIRADFWVIGTKIIVFDGKRGQIIYTHKEQGEKGMVDLVLTGPRIVISAHGCFAIRIDIPATDSVKWEWDCYDPKYAAQVDEGPVSHKIGNIAEVTYMVASNALDATVQVKLRLNDGHSPGSIKGKVTALIDDFRVSKVLFNNTQGMGQCLFSPTDDSRFLLQLDRSVVTVPRSKELHIQVRLEIIGTSNDEGMKHLEADLYIANGILSQCHVVDGGEVEVSIVWYPSPPSVPEGSIRRIRYLPELVYTIGDDGMSYTGFIMAFRRILTDHPGRKGKDILDGHEDPNLSSTRQHPVLTRLKDDEMYLRIKLQVAEEEAWTILVIGMHDLGILGFLNKEHHWYSGFLNKEHHWYSPELLREDLECYWDDNTIPSKLIMEKSKRMGKNFAVNAVRVLWRYGESTQHKPKVAGDGDEEYPVMLALAGLNVMVCDSSRINPVHDSIAGCWNKGTTLTEELVAYVENWKPISSALRDWKDSGYRIWKEDKQLERIGIKSSKDALDVVCLCSADRGNRYYG